MQFLTRFVYPFVCLAILGGCSHYQLGRAGQQLNPAVTRVWIAPVIMKEVIAGVAVPLNRELREQVIRDPAIRLVESKDEADVLLHVSVEQRQRESLARRSNDTGLSDVLRLEIVVSYEVLASDGKPLKQGEVSEEGQVFRDAGFNESARQRIPSMLRDLADDILQEAFMDW